MTKLFMFEKPLGMRDTFPDLYEIKDQTKKKNGTGDEAVGLQVHRDSQP